MTQAPTTLTRTDKAALQLDLGRRRGRAERERIDSDLKSSPWFEVAEACAYHEQCVRLRLKPWQPPPMWVRDIAGILAQGDDGIEGWYAAARLLQKMAGLGISRWHPDPVAAIEAAEAERVS